MGTLVGLAVKGSANKSLEVRRTTYSIQILTHRMTTNREPEMTLRGSDEMRKT